MTYNNNKSFHFTIYFPYLIFLFIFFLWCSSAIAQCHIKGAVTDTSKTSLPFVPVGLLNAKDSTVYKGAVTDQSGNYCFENIRKEFYLLKISTIGYQDYYSEQIPFDSTEVITVPSFTLRSNSTNLKEVGIVAFKPTVEFKKGTVILNVENNLIAKGNSVFDLLKQLPGVTVDAQNNILVNGNGGVRFLMDGRLQQLTDAQMVDILNSMSAELINSIELIKNPPAKYDAAGTAGLINIVTKKAKVKGFNGSVSGAYSQGKRERGLATLTLNYKNNKLSTFSNFNYGYNHFYDVSKYKRTLQTNGETNIFTDNGRTNNYRKSVNFNGGLEYEFTPKTMAGLYITDNFNHGRPVGGGTTDLQGNAFIYNYFNYYSNETQNFNSPNFTFTLLQKLDTLGSQLQLSSNYVAFTGVDNKRIENHFYAVDHSEILSPTAYTTNVSSKANVFYQKVDYTKVLKKDFSIEAGVKGSFLRINNGAQYIIERIVSDTSYQNNYTYIERIYAAYTTLSKTYKKTDVSLGLRAEQTDIDGQSRTSTFALIRNYLNFFPSTSLTYRMNPTNTLSGSYSYRIKRPDFDRMNPAKVYNDEINYNVGNPTIKPQYTHALTVNHTFLSLITTTLDYARTTNFMYWYSYTKPQSQVNVDTTFNFHLRNDYTLSIFIQKQIKWFNFKFYGSMMYHDYKGSVNEVVANSATTQFYTSINTEFLLPENFKVQVYGFYITPFRDAIQLYNPVSSVNVGINKSLLKGKLDMTLGIFDLLYKQNQSLTNDLPGQSYYISNLSDTRRVRLTISYKFGKMHIEQKLKAEEGENRVGK